MTTGGECHDDVRRTRVACRIHAMTMGGAAPRTWNHQQPPWAPARPEAAGHDAARIRQATATRAHIHLLCLPHHTQPARRRWAAAAARARLAHARKRVLRLRRGGRVQGCAREGRRRAAPAVHHGRSRASGAGPAAARSRWGCCVCQQRGPRALVGKRQQRIGWGAAERQPPALAGGCARGAAAAKAVPQRQQGRGAEVEARCQAVLQGRAPAGIAVGGAQALGLPCACVQMGWERGWRLLLCVGVKTAVAAAANTGVKGGGWWVRARSRGCCRSLGMCWCDPYLGRSASLSIKLWRAP